MCLIRTEQTLGVALIVFSRSSPQIPPWAKVHPHLYFAVIICHWHSIPWTSLSCIHSQLSWGISLTLTPSLGCLLKLEMKLSAHTRTTVFLYSQIHTNWEGLVIKIMLLLHTSISTSCMIKCFLKYEVKEKKAFWWLKSSQLIALPSKYQFILTYSCCCPWDVWWKLGEGLHDTYVPFWGSFTKSGDVDTKSVSETRISYKFFHMSFSDPKM